MNTRVLLLVSALDIDTPSLIEELFRSEETTGTGYGLQPPVSTGRPFTNGSGSTHAITATSANASFVLDPSWDDPCGPSGPNRTGRHSAGHRKPQGHQTKVRQQRKRERQNRRQ